MKVKVLFPVIYFSLTSFVKDSNAVIETVQCYVCATMPHLNPECEDTFSVSTDILKLEYANCRYGCAKYKAVIKDKQYISRRCAEEYPHYGCHKGNFFGVDNAEICSCNSDRCNDATTSSVSKTLLVFAAIASVFFIAVR